MELRGRTGLKERREGMVWGKKTSSVHPIIKLIVLAECCQKHRDQCLKCKSGTLHGQMVGMRGFVLRVRYNALHLREHQDL